MSLMMSYLMKGTSIPNSFNSFSLLLIRVREILLSDVH